MTTISELTLRKVVDAPVDSDEYPVSVFVTGDDMEITRCDDCSRPAEEWDRAAGYHPLGRPGAMFHAELYCADCLLESYDPHTGALVNTFWGE
jgi:hypothetical protein